MTRHFNTIIYIDSSNLMSSRGKLDYKKLSNYFKNKYRDESPDDLLELKIFVPIYVNIANERDRFITLLKRLNYKVIITDAFVNEHRSKNYKDNSDLKIAVEMMEDLRDRKVERFILMSGDRDFLFILENIMKAGRQLEIIGPSNATCKEYKSMKNYTPLERIPDIQFDSILHDQFTYRQFREIAV